MVRINVLCSPETVGVVWCGVVSLEEYLENGMAATELAHSPESYIAVMKIKIER